MSFLCFSSYGKIIIFFLILASNTFIFTIKAKAEEIKFTKKHLDYAIDLAFGDNKKLIKNRGVRGEFSYRYVIPNDYQHSFSALVGAWSAPLRVRHDAPGIGLQRFKGAASESNVLEVIKPGLIQGINIKYRNLIAFWPTDNFNKLNLEKMETPIDYPCKIYRKISNDEVEFVITVIDSFDRAKNNIKYQDCIRITFLISYGVSNLKEVFRYSSSHRTWGSVFYYLVIYHAYESGPLEPGMSKEQVLAKIQSLITSTKGDKDE